MSASFFGMDFTGRWTVTIGMSWQACCRTAVALGPRMVSMSAHKCSTDANKLRPRTRLTLKASVKMSSAFQITAECSRSEIILSVYIHTHARPFDNRKPTNTQRWSNLFLLRLHEQILFENWSLIYKLSFFFFFFFLFFFCAVLSLLLGLKSVNNSLLAK